MKIAQMSWLMSCLSASANVMVNVLSQCLSVPLDYKRIEDPLCCSVLALNVV